MSAYAKPEQIINSTGQSLKITEHLWSIQMSHKLIIKLALEELYPIKHPSHYSKVELFGLAQIAVQSITSMNEFKVIDCWILKDDELIQGIFKGSKDQQLRLIYEYYGPSIAIYFAWLAFYCDHLQVPAAAGLILFVYEIYFGNSNDSSLLIWFGLFVSLWSTLFLELWRRRNAELSCLWNIIEAEHQQTSHEYLMVSFFFFSFMVVHASRKIVFFSSSAFIIFNFWSILLIGE